LLTRQSKWRRHEPAASFLAASTPTAALALVVSCLAPQSFIQLGLGTTQTQVDSAAHNPTLQAVLDKAGAYARKYRELCREFVAEERMIQKEYDRKGRLRNQRSFVSDYLIVTLPSDPASTVEFRDILSIDGRLLPRRKHLLKIFEENASNAFREAERATRESTKHNLGRRRYSNMVNFGLNFILPSAQPKMEYAFEQQGGLAANSEWVLLRFNETTDETALRAVTPFGRRPIPSNGLIWLSLPDFRVLRIDFTFKQQDEFYPIAGRYLSEYAPGPDQLLLPSRFEERFFDVKDPARMLLESVATYSNFRRFSAEVKIVPVDLEKKP
jgi:hypothetical protein